MGPKRGRGGPGGGRAAGRGDGRDGGRGGRPGRDAADRVEPAAQVYTYTLICSVLSYSQQTKAVVWLCVFFLCVVHSELCPQSLRRCFQGPPPADQEPQQRRSKRSKTLTQKAQELQQANAEAEAATQADNRRPPPAAKAPPRPPREKAQKKGPSKCDRAPSGLTVVCPCPCLHLVVF